MFKFIKYLFILIVFAGCKKDIDISNQNSIEKNAINEVKKIVGDDGNIFIMPISNDTGNINHTNTDDKINIIKIEIFKNLYEQIQKDTLPHFFKIVIDSATLNFDTYKINSLIFLDDDEDPRPAGLYRYSFGPLKNGNTSFFANLNLAFNTNQDGSINGSPSLYYSGINLFSWQPQQMSQISFNPYTYVSMFAITGTISFGIQTSGGMTIGWTSTITYYVSINMNEYNSNPVIIYSAR